MNRKYSKSSGFYSRTKSAFFTDNARLLAEAEALNRLYTSQPERTNCKLCGEELREPVDFESHGVGYRFCNACGHLNGCKQDTLDFVNKMYVEGDGEDYSKNYLNDDFVQRVEDIYSPKVEFLRASLPEGIRTILDVGCGSGYFVYAALEAGFDASGLDVSATMVDYGNAQLKQLRGCEPLQYKEENAFFSAVETTSAEVISAVGVIEHLREPDRFFESFAKSEASYLFYSVPMFSFSTLLENVSKTVFPRQLSGGHTHLFTESSIKKMHDILGAKSVSEWRFGTDMMDLFRHLSILLQKNGGSERVTAELYSLFGKSVDKLQAVLDESHACSEIHVLAKKIS